tara:strand:+ start:741 stop:848 length:108 start_codon:yes stop_codon:yes gene_type:complete
MNELIHLVIVYGTKESDLNGHNSNGHGIKAGGING